MNIEDWKDKTKVKNEKLIKKVSTAKIICIVYLMMFGYGIYYQLNEFLTGEGNVGYILLVGVSAIFMVMSAMVFLYLHKYGKDVVSNYHKPSKRSWNWYKTLKIIGHNSPTWQFIFTIMLTALLHNFYYYNDILSGVTFFGLLIYVSYSWVTYTNNIRKNQNKIFFNAITRSIMEDISKIAEIPDDWMLEDTNKNKSKLMDSLKKWYDEGCPDDIDYLGWLTSQIIKTRAMVSLDNHDVRKYEQKTDKYSKVGDNLSFK